MKSRLSKTELIGLILLAILIIAITGAAILLKGCQEEQRSDQAVPGSEIRVIDTDLDEDSDQEYGQRKSNGGRRKASGKGRKKSTSSSSRKHSPSTKATKAKSQNSVEFYDPFSDTIPTDEDEILN